MAIWYNGKKVNPLVSFIGTAVVLAAVICFILLLLPFIGGVLLFGVICVAGLVLYGMWYRWRYGDPLERMNRRFAEAVRAAQEGTAQASSSAASRSETRGEAARSGLVKTGVRRTSRVEDADVVEEVRRRPS